jgi:hypothetical protein
MGNPKGVERDFEQLERRRLKAADLFDKGLTQGEVSRKLGVHRQSVSRWHQGWKKCGTKALRKAGRAGRKPRLLSWQLEQLGQGLKEGPEVLGGRARGAGLWHGAVDDLASRRPDRETDWTKVSSRTCVADLAFLGLELPAAGWSGHPT